MLRFDLKDQISTHAPAGGATGTAQLGGREGSYFYSRPCGRGDEWSVIKSVSDADFYSRPCGRGDGFENVNTNGTVEISTHAPAGGATQPLEFRPRFGVSFLLTPLREGRQATTQEAHLAEIISTHAPAGGATQRKRGKQVRKKISTHAPAGGATKDDHAGAAEHQHISTHAPAGGATYDQGNANPCSYDFYSRPCGRGDGNRPEIQDRKRISTHAPAGGATKTSDTKAVAITISTHAPAGGATV